MRNIVILGMVALLLALAGAANAYPTLTGPTGMMIIPTGLIPATGLELAGDWYQLSNRGVSLPTRALLTIDKVLEVGGTFDPFNDNAPLNRAWGMNAKIAMLNFLDGKSALGAQYRQERDQNDMNNDLLQGYFAWTSDFASGDTDDISNFNITLGVNWTRENPEFSDPQYGTRFFSGMTVYITPDIQLMGEYQMKNKHLGDNDATTSVGLRIRFCPEISAQVGYTNSFGFTQLSTHQPFAGIDFVLPADL